MLDLDRFVATRPGEWVADGLHGPRPYTAIGARTFGEPIEQGSRLSFARYGAPSDGIGIAFIERFQYGSQRTLVPRPPGDDTSSRATFEAMLASKPRVHER